MLREVKDVIRVPVDNYQLATLATIKHRSDIIESVDDHDEIEWTEDPYECMDGEPILATTLPEEADQFYHQLQITTHKYRYDSNTRATKPTTEVAGSERRILRHLRYSCSTHVH
jgi:hypothetical protein